MASRTEAGARETESPRRQWYMVLNMYPFVFIPLVAVISVLCAIVLPVLRRMGYW
jgi:hypothetical protein